MCMYACVVAIILSCTVWRFCCVINILLIVLKKYNTGDEDGIKQTVMTSFGKIDVFQPEAEEFSAYLERVELYFEANGIKEDKQVPVFLSLLGAKTYSLLRTLATSESPRNKNFKAVAELLKEHFEPKPLIAERFTFHRRNQHREESIMQYLAELRKLATHCQFKDHLDEALRDRFVCGLNSETIQKWLLTEDKLDLKRALELAQGMKAAHRNAQVLQ